MKKIILVIFSAVLILVQVLSAQISKKFEGHTAYVNAVCFSSGARFIASGGYDGTVKIWDTETGKLLNSFNTKKTTFKLLFSPDSKQVIAGLEPLYGISTALDSFLVAYDIVTGKPDLKFNLISKSPNYYISGQNSELTTITPELLLDSCDVVYDYTLKKYGISNCYKLILNSYNLSSNTFDGNSAIDKIHFWDFNSPWSISSNGKYLVVCPIKDEPEKLTAARENDKNSRINSEEKGSLVYFYDLQNKKLVNKIKIINSYLREKNVILSDDCRYFYFTAVEYMNDVIKVLDIEKDEEVKVLQGHDREILCIALHPGGRLLASGSKDNTIRIWDLHTGKSIKVLEGHKDNVNYVSFSPNGRYLASASDDKNVIIWDLSKVSNEIGYYADKYDIEKGLEKNIEESKSPLIK